jgi:hypothetical protein
MSIQPSNPSPTPNEIPAYVLRAAEAFHRAGRMGVTATVELALALARFERDVSPAFVRSHLPELGLDAPMVSRLRAVNALADRLVKVGLRLNDCASQGVLFALVACARLKMDTELPVLVRDSVHLKIREFRSKHSRRGASRPATTEPLSTEQVCAWVESAERAELLLVARVMLHCLRRKP